MVEGNKEDVVMEEVQLSSAISVGCFVTELRFLVKYFGGFFFLPHRSSLNYFPISEGTINSSVVCSHVRAWQLFLESVVNLQKPDGRIKSRSS